MLFEGHAAPEAGLFLHIVHVAQNRSPLLRNMLWRSTFQASVNGAPT